MTSRFAVAFVLAIVASYATSATAFCRKTTCNPKKSQCETDSAGCVTTGIPTWWDTKALVYRFHEAGSSQLVREEARAAVRAAFHRWSDTVCPDGRRTSLRFVEGEDIVDDKPLDEDAKTPEAFGIYFRDLGWPHDGVDETLALTNTFFSTKTGRILYADIEVNTTRHFAVDEVAPADAKDLQSVMTHEVGHYIGLDHSRVPLSIMAERYCELDDRCTKGRVAARRLGEDDIAAVCALFPPGEPSATPASDGRSPSATGCGATRMRNAEDHSPVIAGLVLGASVFLHRRLRKSKLSAARASH